LLHFIAGILYKNKTDERNMLEWEKVNAVEHVRKANIAEHEKLNNRVIVIEDRLLYLSHTFFFYHHRLHHLFIRSITLAMSKYEYVHS